MKACRTSSDIGNLEHQPFQRRVMRLRFIGEELPRLLRQMNQDRRGFEDRDRLAVRPFGIGRSPDLAVWIDLQEIGLPGLGARSTLCTR